MRPASFGRAALVAVVALGGVWGAAGRGEGLGDEVVYAGVVGSGTADAPHVGPADVAARQAVGRTPVPTALPKPKPVVLLTPQVPVGPADGLVEPKIEPNVVKPSSSNSTGIVTSPAGDVVEAKPQPAEPEKKIDTELVTVPEHLRPGKHSLTFDPVAMRGTRTERRTEGSGGCLEFSGVARPSTVGFENNDLLDDGCALRETYRLAFKFDFSKLRGHTLLPLDATLKFGETPYVERTPDGKSVSNSPLPTCWLALGRPTVDWVGQGGPIPYEHLHDQFKIGTFTDILGVVAPMLNTPDAEERGLILVGQNEEMNEDNGACLSQISEIRLTFTYAIADR
jgi:hypothetical protein